MICLGHCCYLSVFISVLFSFFVLFSSQMNGKSDVVNYLLDNGADVNRVNNRGISILNACHHAFFCHHPRVSRDGRTEGAGERWEGQ